MEDPGQLINLFNEHLRQMVSTSHCLRVEQNHLFTQSSWLLSVSLGRSSGIANLKRLTLITAIGWLLPTLTLIKRRILGKTLGTP